MKFYKKELVEYDVKFLRAAMHVRYTDDCYVNGVEYVSRVEGAELPHLSGDLWDITIDLETGIVQDWKNGMTAKTHFKVSDAGEYQLLNNNKVEIEHYCGYVPGMLSPKGGGYGDYVILEIDSNGKIDSFKADLRDFEMNER